MSPQKEREQERFPLPVKPGKIIKPPSQEETEEDPLDMDKINKIIKESEKFRKEDQKEGQ